MSSPRILIVGGVAGGATAACRLRRLSEEAEIIIFERGDHVSFANCGLPYHLGGTISDRRSLLLQTPGSLWNLYRVAVRIAHEVRSIDSTAKTIRVVDLKTGEEREERYDTLILSPGGVPIHPPIQGIDHPRVRPLRNIADLDALMTFLGEERTKDLPVVILGGGYIGLEAAESLRQALVPVVLVERTAQVMPAADPEFAALLHRELQSHGVDLRLKTTIAELVDARRFTTSCNRKVETPLVSVAFADGTTLDARCVLLATGVLPEATLAHAAGLGLDRGGGILVDRSMRTSDPHIYAIGDAIKPADGRTNPLAGPANRQARIAADAILGTGAVHDRAVYRQISLRTSVCRVFDKTFATTGYNEATCRRSGQPCDTVTIHATQHVSYYPGAMPLMLKIVFSPKDGQLLGAQCIGAEGVDKRIDIIATVIKFGGTVRELTDLELCYSPPFGSAKDPVQLAGFVATNRLDGLVRHADFQEMRDPPTTTLLLDVRSVAEHQRGAIPGSLNIPIDELRARLDELPTDKELLVYCAAGFRGYLACRILQQNGYRCKNFSGGYKVYALKEECSTEVGMDDGLRLL